MPLKKVPLEPTHMKRGRKPKLPPDRYHGRNLIVWVFPQTQDLVYRCVRLSGLSLSEWCERAMYKAAVKELKKAGQEIPSFSAHIPTINHH